MFFCDRRYDGDEGLGARNHDPAARAPYYRDAGNRLIEELPIIPLGFERRTFAVNKRLRGFRPNVLGRDSWNAWELGAAPSSLSGFARRATTSDSGEARTRRIDEVDPLGPGKHRAALLEERARAFAEIGRSHDGTEVQRFDR